MKITIYSLGGSKHKFLLEGEQEYLKRMGRDAKAALIDLGPAKSSGAGGEGAKSAQGKLLLARLKPSEFLIALDENGKSFTSTGFAAFLKDSMNRGISSFTFAVAGPDGWSPAVKERAGLRLSLSPMTFTSQMARLLLVEQLYRALCIIKGKPYHK
jgi:23S rRNA (pseudouridine1915-N3)-methyltransferase